MHLRSGEKLPKMTRPTFKHPPRPWSNAHNVEEKPMYSTVDNVGTSTTVGENPIIIS